MRFNLFYKAKYTFSLERMSNRIDISKMQMCIHRELRYLQSEEYIYTWEYI